MRLAWREGEPAPVTMWCYGAVVHGNTAYFSLDYDIYSFVSGTWKQLKQCGYKYFSMAVVNDKLTTIGGQHGVALTNTLLCLSSSETKWEKLLPPMPTKRVGSAAVTTPTHLVVAGGRSGVLIGGATVPLTFAGLATVEILNLRTQQWASASSSPIALRFANMTVCGEHVYLSEDKSIFSCSLEELIRPAFSVWSRIADIPTSFGASLTTFNGCVLAVGGKNGNTPTRAIYCYDRSTNSWNLIGGMPTPRSYPLVATLPHNELVVVGGEASKVTEMACHY